MLTAYQTQLQGLLQNPGAPATLYAPADLTRWINISRGQLAGEAECLRAIGTLTTVAGQQAYNFSSLNLGTSAVTGIDSAIHVRRIAYGVGAGQRWIPGQAWPWFDLYELNNPVPQQGAPKTWAQYAQGAAPGASGAGRGGSFYISPPPDFAYTLFCDCVCFPIALIDDTTVEAVPYLWTDAVPFFAAYYALLSSQTSARMADAERYFNHYQTFFERGRKAANPSVQRWQFEQALDPAQAAKLGVKPAGGG